MHKVTSLLIAAIFHFTGLCQTVTEKIIIEDTHGKNKLEVKLPKDYRINNASSYSTVLHSPSPSWAISYENEKVVLTSTHTVRPVDDNGIPAFTDQLIAMIKEKTTEAKIVDDGILLQDGKNIGYIKFYSKEKGQKKYNYLFYASAGNRLVLFSFSCPQKIRKSWESVAEKIAGSLRVIE